MKRSSRWALFLVLAAALVLTTPTRAEKIRLTNDIAWVKEADSFKAVVYQAYRNGMERLRKLAQGEKAGSWAVVLDADETIINNVQFQIELQLAGQEYSGAAWNEWCNRAEATPLPGAIEFCTLAKELGGKVIIITNRQEPVKQATALNLKKAGIPYDVLLVREGPYAQDRSKQMRRDDVAQGTIKTLPEGQKLPPLKILMLVGDQTHDLYDDKGLKFEDVKERFAKDFIIVPNPMYGDWAYNGVFVEKKTIVATAAPAAAAVEGVPAVEGAITWQEAMSRIDQEVVVEAKIVSVFDPTAQGRSGPVKLNVDRNWRESLTIVFFKTDRSGKDQGFPDPNQFINKTVRVKGRVQDYKGAKQIMLKSPGQITIIE